MSSDILTGPYSLSSKLLNAAEELLLVTQERRGALPSSYYVVLLSSLERIIDASRNTVEPGSGISNPDDKAEVESRLGDLRVKISKLAKTCDTEELRNELNTFMDRLERHFFPEN